MAGVSVHDAARNGNLDQFNQLVAEGADLDQKDKLQRTPLHLAAWAGQTVRGGWGGWWRALPAATSSTRFWGGTQVDDGGPTACYVPHGRLPTLRVMVFKTLSPLCRAPSASLRPPPCDHL